MSFRDTQWELFIFQHFQIVENMKDIDRMSMVSLCLQDEPFTSFTSEQLFNIARFLVHELLRIQPKGISKFAALYALARQARTLGAFKTARYALDKLQGVRIPRSYQVRQSLTEIRSPPFSKLILNELFTGGSWPCLIGHQVQAISRQWRPTASLLPLFHYKSTYQHQGKLLCELCPAIPSFLFSFW